jgi:2-oxoglutarate/2-oxoacid ferredoxin oxidoreductase subunit beta
MTLTAELEYRQYLRLDMMPHILCPGCGHGTVLKAILRAIHGLGLDRERLVFVSGIGCSSRLVGYVDFCTLHTTHGRPLTFATGLKLARPDLHVVVITGDGDGLAIGGNHLIHAARRNIDLTCLLLNNATYGMTGGQGAPTTPPGARTSTMRDGTVEPDFDACQLVRGAGGTFVARGMTAAPLGLDDLIARAIQHRGFSFVEIISDCPEFFGRYNGLGRGPEMLEAQRRHLEEIDELLEDKRFVTGLEPPAAWRPAWTSGVLHQETRAELSEQLRARAGNERQPVVRPTPVTAREAGEPTGDVAMRDRQASDGAPYEVRLAGAGGQGIVLAGLLLAEAAVAAGKNATHAQAYGPESRGGATRAEVIVADGDIDYPCVDRVDFLLALTHEAHERYAAQVKPGGVVLVDGEQAPPAPAGDITRYALPLLATAQRVLGTQVGANLVALGALVALSGVIPATAMEDAIAARRPGGSTERALRAFRAGSELGRRAGASVRADTPHTPP